MYKLRNGDVVTINPLMDAKKLFKCMFSESDLGSKELEKFENEIRVANVMEDYSRDLRGRFAKAIGLSWCIGSNPISSAITTKGELNERKICKRIGT